jgi:hypothetical protein
VTGFITFGRAFFNATGTFGTGLTAFLACFEISLESGATTFEGFALDLTADLAAGFAADSFAALTGFLEVLVGFVFFAMPQTID